MGLSTIGLISSGGSMLREMVHLCDCLRDGRVIGLFGDNLGTEGGVGGECASPAGKQLPAVVREQQDRFSVPELYGFNQPSDSS